MLRPVWLNSGYLDGVNSWLETTRKFNRPEMVDGDRFEVVRPREEIADLFATERMLDR